MQHTFNLAESHKVTNPKLDKGYVIYMAFLHLSAIGAFFYWSWSHVLTFIVLYFLSGLGITVGYHRLITHQSFKCPKFIEYGFAILGNLANEGGPITWVANHRQHHAESDTELDPHDISQGFGWAHMWWVFMRYPTWYENNIKTNFTPDLMKQPFYRILDKYNYVLPSLVGLALFLIGGLPLFLWGYSLRIAAMYHSTWFVNSAAHKWGYRPFKKEIATNNWWVALLSFGEGWHNNHHAFPVSARHGLRFWEFDVSWIVIWTMSKVKLASKVRLPANSELPWKKESLIRRSIGTNV